MPYVTLVDVTFVMALMPGAALHDQTSHSDGVWAARNDDVGGGAEDSVVALPRLWFRVHYFVQDKNGAARIFEPRQHFALHGRNHVFHDFQAARNPLHYEFGLNRRNNWQ